MKKKFSVLACLLALCVSAGLAGCDMGGSAVSDPTDAIKQQYGTQEFKISFSSENLSEPLSDIVYSAYDMPKMPTPERVGYIFEGWYLDKNYTMPYTEGILYLYMKDVTLYAKWSKEDFVNDGTYDIEISAEIVEGSLSLGTLAEEYGWKNLTEDIIAEDTYIEKTENGLQLKLTYDNGSTPPYGQAAAYRILPSVSMGSSVYQSESIVPDNESVHSLFFNLNNFDIANPLYFDVISTNWQTDLLATDALETSATYTVKFTVKRLIGFSQSYVDADVAADAGYYLVKTHFTKEDGTASMLESYNSVYAYVIVDEDGNYTLVKPFMPYSGMVESVDNETLSHYYSRNMTFAPTQLYYEITVPESAGEAAASDYFADYYKGGAYGNFTLEFHADTGRYYQIFDLGKSFKRSFMIRGATTGFMEMAFAMGAYNSIMTIDYEHIVKISEIDYIPLSGENFSCADSLQYYTGRLSDLNSQNGAKSAVEKGGVASEMINLFYSAPSLDAPTSARTMHSFRMTVTPTAATNAETVKNSRYKIAEFNINYGVFGYDPKGGQNLYADSMTSTNFGTDGIARRENLQIVCGKAVNTGDKIWFNELYNEKVNANSKYTESTVIVYPLKSDGVPNYSSGKTVSVNTAYSFTDNIAVEFTVGNTISLVYLKQYSDPVCEVINTQTNTYSEYGHTVGDTVLFPIVRYTYMGNTGGFIDEYYPSEDGTMVVDPTRVALYAVNGDTYSLAYLTGTLNFSMSTNHMIVAYECRNEFGEIYFYYLHFYAQSQTQYTLTEDGEEISNGTLSYYQDTGERRPIQILSREGREIASVSDIASKQYKITYGSTEIPLTVSQAELYANGEYKQLTVDIFNQLTAATVSSDYYIIILTYSCGQDYFRLYYEYNLLFDGKKQFAFVTDEVTFTGYEYLLKCPDVVSVEGTILGEGNLEVRKYTNGGYYSAQGAVEFTRYGKSYAVSFISTGIYRFVYSVTLNYDEYGNRLFDGKSVTLDFYQDIEVIDGKGDVTVTYITDVLHPFADGFSYTEVVDGSGNVTGYAYTVTYNLANSILTMAQQDGDVQNFVINGTDRLFGWLKREDYTVLEAPKALRRGTLISNFIGEFGSREVTLYALWDCGLIVNVDRAEDITGLTPQVITKWLSTGSYNYGVYSLSVNSLEFNAPTGYVHKGWFIDGIFYEANSLSTLYFTDNQSVDVSVVLVKQYTVRYIVNTAYGSRLADGTVEQGETIAFPTVTSKAGYSFKGWRLVTSYMNNSDFTVANDTVDELTSIDEEEALCQVNGRQAVILVAVFVDSEGNEVW